MGAAELEIAGEFQAALETAAKTGDREALYSFLAPDVEWVAPMRTLQGIDEVKQQMIWGMPPEHLDLEFTVSDWADLADGRVACDAHEVFRMKTTGEFAYERNLHIELTIRDGKIARYAMRTIES
jgi:ketosteroid isomerase-like protein